MPSARPSCQLFRFRPRPFVATPFRPRLRHLAAALAATLAVPASAQWVGFGASAWPAGSCASDRGSLGGAAREVLVRLDAHEHGGWGTALGAGIRAIDGVQFMAHDTAGLANLVTVVLYPEDPTPGADHFPDPTTPIVFGSVTVPSGPCPVLLTLPGPMTPVPCQANGDIFVGFRFAAADGIQIGRIDATTPPGFDVPGAAYIGGAAYPGAIPVSHRLERNPVNSPFFVYLPGPSQYFVDVSQGPGLATGVGGTITSQLTFPNSAPTPGTSNFLSGSYPDCVGGLGSRALAPPDSISMSSHAPFLPPFSPVYFTVSTAPIRPCFLELPLFLIFPGVSSGVVCIDPSTIIYDAIVLQNGTGDALLTLGPLWATLRGFGVTHQAFAINAGSFSVHAGPCDRQEF